MTTCDRPELFKLCLEAASRAKEVPINVQLIVVDESDNKIPYSWLNDIDIVIRKKKEGMWGSYAKDAGIRVASGEFVCFWDDDNTYNDDAVITLYEAASNHDIGVVQVELHDGDKIPPDRFENIFVNTKIDTMCFCVRTEIAKKFLWVDDSDKRNTDFRWISRIAEVTDNINFIKRPIGTLIPWDVHCKSAS